MTRLLFLCVFVSFFCRTSFAWQGLWNYSLPSNPFYTVKTFRLDPDEALELFGVDPSIDYYYSYGSFTFDSRDPTPISGILRLTKEEAFTQHQLCIEFLNFFKVGLRIEIPENNNQTIDILPQKVPTQNHYE